MAVPSVKKVWFSSAVGGRIKSMPCTGPETDMSYCADCESKLWHHCNTINRDIRFFSCSNYKTDTRGTCQSRHYIRADAIEQVVLMELRRLADFLRDDEDALAEILEQKTEAAR